MVSTVSDPELLNRLSRMLKAHWGLECTAVEPIKVRENAVFAVYLQDGGKVVLRVHRRGYHSDAALSSECTWMRALAGAGIEVPRHVLSERGNPFECLLIEGFAGLRQVDVFHWINGPQLGSIEKGLATEAGGVGEIFRKLGTLAGQIHNQSSAWPLPPNFNRHAWNAAGLAGEQPFWGQFWQLEMLSAAERALFIRLKDTLYRDLQALGTKPAQYSLIHADLLPENILVDGTRLQVIDFDDAGFGWHLFELATSLYFLRREPFYDEARDALIEGYRQARPLSDSHLALLPMFLAARGSTYLGWIHTRQGEPTAHEMAPQLIEAAALAAEDYFAAASTGKPQP